MGTGTVGVGWSHFGRDTETCFDRDVLVAYDGTKKVFLVALAKF